MPLVTVKDKESPRAAETKQNPQSEEFVIFCPHCKAFQTVWVNDNKLTPTRKFIQEGRQIYHDCGSRQPCRLYKTW